MLVSISSAQPERALCSYQCFVEIIVFWRHGSYAISLRMRREELSLAIQQDDAFQSLRLLQVCVWPRSTPEEPTHGA